MKDLWNATPPQLKSVRRRRLTAQWSRCISPRFLSVIFVTAFLCTKASAESADFDGSGKVDLLDFFLFADAFGGSLSRYDLNCNGRVDLADFFIFSDSFGKQKLSIYAIVQTPSEEVYISEIVTVTAITKGAGSEELLYRWSASRGSFSTDYLSRSVNWTAPPDEGTYTVHLIVRSADGEARDSIRVEVTNPHVDSDGGCLHDSDFDGICDEATWNFTTEDAPAPVNGAVFIFQNVPNTLLPGEISSLDVTLRNTGNTIWKRAAKIKLGSQNPGGNKTWGFNRVRLGASETVSPGEEHKFSFDITAPQTEAPYNFQWRMVQDGGGTWFGEQTENVVINVTSVQPSNNIILPVEVIGADYTVVSRSFDLVSASGASALWMQVNNLSYDNKASVWVNSGPWVSITNASVNMQEPEKTFGGIGGEFSTVRFSVPVKNFVSGTNTVEFRFNQHDGLSMGYRIIRFNVLDGGHNNLIPESSFEFEDPDTWKAPITGSQAIANGQAIWETAALKKPGTSTPRNAKCMDCHLKTGYDLEYFSYSNLSIIERSKFHGLSQEEGEEVASYIRSLSAERHGRPWNPPYQPGAELNGKPIEEWAAGAGLDALLDKDTDMEPYLFPNGTSQEEVNKVVEFDSHLDVTELPIAILLPDWKSWLPEIHPKDIWPTGYFEGENASQEYQLAISALENTSAQDLITSGNVISIVNNFHAEVKKWIAKGRNNNDGGRAGRWRVYSGTVINNVKSEFPREYAKLNYAKWMAVKFFEMMHEYELEYYSHLNPAVGLADPVEGTRQWPGTDRTLFEIPPHFTADNYLHYADQTMVEGKYMSSAWYQLQMLVHAGEYDQLVKGGPMDWAYHFLHIYGMNHNGAPREGFRYMSSFLKLWQTRSNNYAPNDFELGWRMRYVHPWWIYSDELGDQSSMNDLNANDAGLRVKLYNAIISEWVDEARKYDLATWPRSDDDWIDLDPKNHVPSAANVDFGSRRLWKAAQQHHADYFYVLIPRLVVLGVDIEILTKLRDWCEEAWSLGDWAG